MSSIKKNSGFPLLMPLVILFTLILINLIADPFVLAKNPEAMRFFDFELRVDNFGNTIVYGTIVNIINSASEVVILAIGMALVTAASGGQDISVGAVAAIAGSVFIKIIRTSEDVTWSLVLIAFLASCVVSMLCGMFNGTLVAVFRIQPMIATLVLFTSGRSIAYAVNGGASPKLFDDITRQIGGYFSGSPIQTSVYIVLIYGLIFFLVFKFTNLRLYAESVGINEKAARLNGLNPVAIKIMVYAILGFCVAGAGVLNTCRMQRLDHLGILGGVEMNTILAVAIGGNALGGGKFSIAGAVIGAYTLETLNTTLLRLGVEPEPIFVYKAAVIILLMIVSSPVLKTSVNKALSRKKKINDRGAVQHAEN